MMEGTCIENGYFVFTLMPSLRCSMNCPHCYLTEEQRRTSPVLSLNDLEEACRKVDLYYRSQPRLKTKQIVCYWYGGEPTELGQDYFTEAVDLIGKVFDKAAGYQVRHEVLTSLVAVDPSWYQILKGACDSRLQTSYDGLMRGEEYLARWKTKVQEATQAGLSIGTLSVVNRHLIDEGPETVYDYLATLGISEAGFLPFMLNDQNEGEIYQDLAPSMMEYSEFMIRLTRHALQRQARGETVPEIGEFNYILGQSQNRGAYANTAAQTLFLMPDGSMCLPDYEGFHERMISFGNIKEQFFAQILHSQERRDYVRKQALRNGNPECGDCEAARHCLMEFWKCNRDGDDCFGAKHYVSWVMRHATSNQLQRTAQMRFC